MTLKEKINTDFLIAYKNKEMNKKNFLGVVKGAIQTQEGKLVESTDENVLKVIKSIEKGIHENIEGRLKMGLGIIEESLELTYIKQYQPTLMGEDEIRTLVKGLIGVSTNKNLGVLMGMFNKENAGKAFDNKVVANIIKQELNTAL